MNRASILAVLLLAGCPPGTGPDDTTGSDTLACGPLTTSFDEIGLLRASFDDGYGVNHAFVWDVEDRDAAGAHDYWYAGTEIPLSNDIPAEGWVYPAEPRWMAWRPVRTDGYDPMLFPAEAPFVIGYLPPAPSVGWTGVSGQGNDGTCPVADAVIDGLPRCLGTWQLDLDHPYPLPPGQLLQVQLLFGFNLNETSNRVVACEQGVVVVPAD